MPIRIMLFFSALALAANGTVAECRGATWYVDAGRGGDEGNGRSPEKPLRALQRACDLVEPGDAVIIAPGVYRGPGRLGRAGLPGRPIVFRTDAVGRNRVVVTPGALGRCGLDAGGRVARAVRDPVR